jgi:hypothetical protein
MIVVAGAVRAYPGEAVSGDGWRVDRFPTGGGVAGSGDGAGGEGTDADADAGDEHGGSERSGAGVRIAVVDGLGHGAPAAAAARAALETLAARPALDPAAGLHACHAALRSTRGAAATIVRIDPAAATLTYAGVGNVEGRLWCPSRTDRLLVQRGIVGATFPRTVRPVTLPLDAGWLLVLHSDGISARFDLDQLPETAQRDPDALAERLLREWSRATDDATVVDALEIVTPA